MNFTEDEVADLVAAQFGITKVQAAMAAPKIKANMKRLPEELRDSRSAQIWATLAAVLPHEQMSKVYSDLRQIVESEVEVPKAIRNVFSAFVDDGAVLGPLFYGRVL